MELRAERAGLRLGVADKLNGICFFFSLSFLATVSILSLFISLLRQEQQKHARGEDLKMKTDLHFSRKGNLIRSIVFSILLKKRASIHTLKSVQHWG